MTADRSVVPLEDPQARLERALIDEYLRARGVDLQTIGTLPEAQATVLMREAALYAAGRLTEVEARATYIHEIHGVSSRE